MEGASRSAFVATRPRAFVRVAGPGAEDYLQRMVSNDVAGLQPGEACDALLLTPKARVIAPLRVLRRGADDFLLLSEPELGDVVRTHLLKFRFAAQAEIEPEQHESFLLLGEAAPPAGAVSLPNVDYGLPGFELLDAPEPADAARMEPAELERMRIEAGTPAWGKEIDERVLPAEAGLVERAVSLTKGCYPGQEPIARLHYRGHANRALRTLRLVGDEVPAPETQIRHGERVVGRVTSAARSDGGVVALAYVRTEVPAGAGLTVGNAEAQLLGRREPGDR